MDKGLQPDSVQVQSAPVPVPFPVEGVNPGPRCGHTLTVIINSDGDLSKAKLVMFGGATALEGPDGATQPTAASAAGIRLAGATNDVHIMEFRSGKWTKIEPLGELPAPRAAHAAAAVGSMMVVQGGIGPAGLASEDLHVLDFSNPELPRWHRVFVNGQGPSARYAHTLALVANRFIVAMGGNDGRNTLQDAWALDTSEKPYQWRKVTATGLFPPARMYATAAARQDGLLLLCGGRSEKGQPLNDAYGLARHRDGRWEWAAAPHAMPAGRYQHAAVFVGARLHVSGGSLGGGKMVDKRDSVLVLDSTAGVWTMPAKRDGSEDLSRRCRHAVAAVGPYIFVHGGLMGSTLHSDLLLADDGGMKDLATYDPRSTPWMKWLESDNQAAQMLAHNAAEEAAAASTLIVHRVATEGEPMAEDYVKPPSPPASEGGSGKELVFAGGAAGKAPGDDDDGGEVQVRLFHRAVVVANNQSGSMRGIVLQLSIDQFENESRRVATGMPLAPTPNKFSLSDPARTSMFSVNAADPGVHRRVIAELLRPRDWKAPEDRTFFLRAKEIDDLCNMAEACLQQEPTVLKLHAPIKIFGDLHGQFGDLMRLFEEYGMPSTAGDITYIDYLFLGDYVDRGAYSLETICLLLALKVEHPRSVHLLRGNHEAADINALFGFRMECMERMGQYGVFIWQRINQVFNWLPLAAHIEGKILCMHGGIGRSINQIKQIEVLSRPLTMEQGGVVLMDLLWSDPTTNDGVQLGSAGVCDRQPKDSGVRPSPRGPGLVTFGPDRVKDFCKNNNMQIIVRAHECVMDGFERFAQGHLITLFSATNYCGTANNAGAILVLGRDLVMVPKLIHPLPPTSPASIGMMGGPAESQPQLDTWMQSINEERPPTPPRGRPDLNGDGPASLSYF